MVSFEFCYHYVQENVPRAMTDLRARNVFDAEHEKYTRSESIVLVTTTIHDSWILLPAAAISIGMVVQTVEARFVEADRKAGARSDGGLCSILCCWKSLHSM